MHDIVDKRSKFLTQEQVDDMKIVGIGMAAGDQVQTLTAHSIALMVGTCRSVKMMPVFVMGQDPGQARNDYTKICVLDHRTDYLLMIDSDMIFPMNALDRLLAHDVDIVGADYRRRRTPYDRLGISVNPMPEDARGLHEMQMIPFGFILIKRKVFMTLPRPYFVRPYKENGASTEDIYFCNNARQAGFKVWCDMDLTREVYHLGQQAVPWEIKQGAVPA